MSLTHTATVEVREDHTATIKLPVEIPTGPVTITYTVAESLVPVTQDEQEPRSEGDASWNAWDESADGPRPRTGAELVAWLDKDGFFGSLADRDDLPRTNEEFIAWRKKIWEGEPY